MGSRARAAGWALVLFGCGDPVVAVDAATSDASMPIGAVVVAAPSWGTCPDGWSARDLDGASVCAPPDRVTCTGASFQPVGAAACEPVDRGCGTGRFRSSLPTDRTFVYVDAAAGAGGDGSSTQPFRSIDDALAAGGSPLGVALAAGDYTITHALPADVSIVGACAASVRLGAASGSAAVLVAAGARARIEGVTIGGDGFGIASRGDVTATNVVIDGAGTVGVGGLGGTVALDRVLVRATHTASDGTFGRGVSLAMGAHATLRDVVVEDSRDAGLSVEGATLVGERVVVSRTMPNDLGRFGSGVSGFDGAQVTLSSSLIVASSNIGVEDDASMLSLDGVVVRGGAGGLGVLATNASATLSHVWIDGAAGSGLAATGSASDVHASDLVVTATELRAGSGGAIGATDGAHVTLSRTSVLDSRGSGVVVLASTLHASDLGVQRVSEAPELGQALLVGQGGDAEVERFEFAHAQAVAVMVSGAGSRGALAHGRVEHVDAGATFDVGRGVEADVGGAITLDDVLVSDVIETGIVSYGDGTSGTSITIDGVRVERVHERACASSSCSTEGGGTALTALGAGAIVAGRLDVDGAPLCGVQVAESGSLDLTSGSIARSAIGACVQIEGYDLARIVSGVVFVDDARNVETASVYVPPRAPAL